MGVKNILGELRVNDSKVVTEATLGNYSKGLAYTSNEDGTCYVSGIGTCTDTELIIPSSYDGEKVTSIGYQAFMSKTKLTRVVIPNTVKRIEEQAFINAINLKEVIIPNSVTYIGISAFHSCSSITNLEIPNSVTEIDESAFGGMTSLTSIVIPKSVTAMRRNIFGSTNLTICCEATSKPSGWDTDWNPYNRPVIWGAAANLGKVNVEIDNVKNDIANIFPATYSTTSISKTVSISGWWHLNIHLGYLVDLGIHYIPSSGSKYIPIHYNGHNLYVKFTDGKWTLLKEDIYTESSNFPAAYMNGYKLS